MKRVASIIKNNNKYGNEGIQISAFGNASGKVILAASLPTAGVVDITHDQIKKYGISVIESEMYWEDITVYIYRCNPFNGFSICDNAVRHLLTMILFPSSI